MKQILLAALFFWLAAVYYDSSQRGAVSASRSDDYKALMRLIYKAIAFAFWVGAAWMLRG